IRADAAQYRYRRGADDRRSAADGDWQSRDRGGLVTPAAGHGVGRRRRRAFVDLAERADVAGRCGVISRQTSRPESGVPVKLVANLSLKRKLMLISIVPTAALLVASATFVAYDYVAVHSEQVRLDQRLAESLAARTSLPVSLGNPRATRLMLAALD